MTPGERDDLEDYLTEAMTDPVFRAAYEALDDDEPEDDIDESIRRGLEQAERGETVYLGSFALDADEPFDECDGGDLDPA